MDQLHLSTAPGAALWYTRFGDTRQRSPLAGLTEHRRQRLAERITFVICLVASGYEAHRNRLSETKTTKS